MAQMGVQLALLKECQRLSKNVQKLI
uniref:Uncharacterized protein n=1 Tax=Tetranychus urticae TaxID=32264 RepID=T1KII9_TETUR